MLHNRISTKSEERTLTIEQRRRIARILLKHYGHQPRFSIKQRCLMLSIILALLLAAIIAVTQ